MHWSESKNYSTLEGIRRISLSGANHATGTDAYVNESTRGGGILDNADSRPSVVLAGQYKEGGNDMSTFYLQRTGGKRYIYTETEYISAISEVQTEIFKENGERPTSSELTSLLTLSSPETDGEPAPDYVVSPQLRTDAQLSGFRDKSGAGLSADAVNRALRTQFGVIEKFDGGKCVFLVPIEHFPHGDKTLYGLVRNHHYTLTLKSIEGVGRGVGNVMSEITDVEFPDLKASYKINSTLKVNGWTELSQDIVIKR